MICQSLILLSRDPARGSITALNVYLTPKTSVTGNWQDKTPSKHFASISLRFCRIEIVYGTNSGIIRIVVEHPRTIRRG